MWQEYTRVKPARRGLALVAAAAALAGSTALAWAVIQRKQHPVALEPAALPRGWPIAFALPAGVDPLFLEAYDFSPEFFLRDRNRGVEAFRIDRGPLGHCTIWFAYRLVPPESSWREAWDLFNDSRPDLVPPDEGEAVAFDAFSGRIWDCRSPEVGRLLIALACRPDGLAVRVEFHLQSVHRVDLRLFRDVCASIRSVPWRVSRY